MPFSGLASAAPHLSGSEELRTGHEHEMWMWRNWKEDKTSASVRVCLMVSYLRLLSWFTQYGNSVNQKKGKVIWLDYVSLLLKISIYSSQMHWSVIQFCPKGKTSPKRNPPETLGHNFSETRENFGIYRIGSHVEWQLWGTNIQRLETWKTEDFVLR